MDCINTVNMNTINSKSAMLNDAHWNSQRAKLKIKFPSLTAQDVYFKHGQKEDMLDRLQEKLKMTKEEFLAMLMAL